MRLKHLPSSDFDHDAGKDAERLGVQYKIVEVSVRSANAQERRLPVAVHRRRIEQGTGLGDPLHRPSAVAQDSLKLVGQDGVVLLALFVDDLGRGAAETSVVSLLVGLEQLLQ